MLKSRRRKRKSGGAHRAAGGRMRVEIPRDIVIRAGANKGDLRLAMAVQFYADNRIDHADACRLADIPAAELNRELLARGLSIHQYPSVETAGSHRAAS